MARLTLCMIVKNEERWLRDCLASVASVVDAMVIVDTGSDDATLAIAAEFGAEIVHFDWIDDFAAARNAGLARIEDGYVLVLDADERLTPEGALTLRRAADAAEIDLGLLPYHDASHEGASVDAILSGRARIGEAIWIPRFLRTTPDLAYEGIVHESVGRWAAKQSRREHVEAPILHFGSVEEARETKQKSTRNRRLLERRCQLEPNNPIPHAYLAAELRRAGDLQGALRSARAGWAAWTAEGPGGTSDPVFPATLAAHMTLLAGEFDEAEAILKKALTVETHPNLHLLSGVVIEQRWMSRGGETKQLDDAASHYTRCLAMHEEAFSSELMPGSTSWQAATRLGTVEFLRGRFAKARAAFTHALESDSGSREANLGRIEAELAAGNTREALTALEAHLYDDEPDGWLLAGESSRDCGNAADARLFAERCRAIAGSHLFVGKHRERRLAELEAGCETPEVCVFAWPRYDEASDLDALLGRYGKLLCEVPGVVLCLRHDTAIDGSPDGAAERIESAFARHLDPSATLSVILVDQPLETPTEIAALAGPGDVALELPSTDAQPFRRRFLDDLGARRASAPEQLRRALARKAAGPDPSSAIGLPASA